ncbi:MAG TPA: efflux RND transporter periplasmic adaptor subunit [Ensifer sp.]|nr:efflux RND transporter periplasmic adaptor subunit [Ensifer sp.]
MKMKTLKANWLIATVAIVMAAPAFAEDAPATPAAKPAINAPSIVVTAVTERSLTDRVLTSGTIQPVEEVYVQPLVESLSIKTLQADVGDRVKAGDVLATLMDDTLILQKSQLEANKAKVIAAGAQAEAQRLSVKTTLDEANRQLGRGEQLAKTGTISTAQLDQLRASATSASASLNSADQAIKSNAADMKVIEAQIADIDLKLSRTEVKAPVDGVISARTAKVGAIASGAGQPLFTLIRDNALELKADLAEEDVLKVAKGQKVTISLAGSGTKISGTVLKVEPTVNATTRLGTVEVKIDNPDAVRSGMYAQADIIVAERTAPALPVTAVTTGSDATTARLVKDQVVHIVPVETGIQDGQYIEIRRGLQTGDKVVAKAGAYVREGDRVKPVESLAAATN